VLIVSIINPPQALVVLSERLPQEPEQAPPARVHLLLPLLQLALPSMAAPPPLQVLLVVPGLLAVPLLLQVLLLLALLPGLRREVAVLLTLPSFLHPLRVSALLCLAPDLCWFKDKITCDPILYCDKCYLNNYIYLISNNNYTYKP